VVGIGRARETQMASIRTFVAIELPGAVRDRLGEVSRSLAHMGPRIRWVRPHSLHITLKFIGDVDASRIPELVEVVGRVSSAHDPFQLATTEVGGFPSVSKARVVWVGLRGHLESLARLQRDVEASLAQLEIPRDRRPFSPHVTLGRARRGPVDIGSPDAGSAKPTWFGVDRITLMQSELRPDGAVHTPLGFGALGSPHRNGQSA